MGYSATHLQHYFLTFSALVFLALSLPINGTDWKEQFGGWTAGQWLILAFESSIAYVGSAAAMQVRWRFSKSGCSCQGEEHLLNIVFLIWTFFPSLPKELGP